MKLRPVVADFFLCEWTELTNLIVAIRAFENAAKN